MSKKKLGIGILVNETRAIETYGKFLLQQIAEVTDELIIGYEKGLSQSSMDDLTESVKSGLGHNKSIQFILISQGIQNKSVYLLKYAEEQFAYFDTVILFDDTVFGPFYSLHEIMISMDKEKFDCWGMLKHATGKETPAYFDSCFFVFHNLVSYKETLFAMLDSQSVVDPEQLASEGLKVGAYADTKQYDFPEKENNQNYLYYYNYDLLKNEKFPFIKCNAFCFVDGLDYSHRQDLKNSLAYAVHTLGYDENLVWDYILKYYDMSDIKECLSLYYLVESGETKEQEIENRKKAAVFMHLFYEDLLDETLEYVSNIPAGVDLYVTTHGETQMAYVKKKLKDFGRENDKVLEAGARGRDAAALLVVCRKYIVQYEFICFVHDKKTSGGKGPKMTGDTFREVVFDNTIPSADFIRNVLLLFEQNERLGFLSPVCPVIKAYQDFYGGFGNQWTVCYEQTKALAKRLGICAPMSREKHPIALSNTFWCRVKALQKVFDYEWKFADFPSEPLAEDGTLNHAIERIYSYAAQDSGYYSGMILERNFAANYTNNLVSSLSELLRLLRGNLNFGISRSVAESIVQIGKEYTTYCAWEGERTLFLEENQKKEKYIEKLKLEIEQQKRQTEYEYGQKRLYIEENEKKREYILRLQQEIEIQKQHKNREQAQKQLYMEENKKKEAYILELQQENAIMAQQIKKKDCEENCE